MTTPPLTKPRRWSVDVDGIKWLPRMIDKARMREGGALGAYLLGHSPVDRSLLERLGMSTDEFAALACRCADDPAALAALRTRGFDEARVRKWSDNFETRFKVYIPLWDLDEGYREPKAFEKPIIALMRTIEGPLMGLARKLLKAP